MSVEHVDTLIIGCGQAGLATSEHLNRRGVPHLILERNRIAESWRTARWDSLVANGPVWHDRFPSMGFDEMDPDAFAPRDRVVEYFVALAGQINAPVRCGVEATSLEKAADGFRVQTSDGEIIARNVVAATGAFQKPVFPAIVPTDAPVTQIHSHRYRNPQQLPEGAVLVIGAGSSGAQIAEELMEAGRKVYLSVGPHDRPPRRYRGKDFVWWLGALGIWDTTTPAPGTEHVTIAVSGAHGGRTVDFRKFAARGMTLLGRAEGYADGRITFASDLKNNIEMGDANYLSLLDRADAYVAENGLDLPEEPDARNFDPDPACVVNPILNLDLSEEGITTIIWATGYVQDFGWMKLDAFDEKGRPVHQRGVSEIPGLYFIGLPWLSRRASSFIWGVWHDADYVAEHIAGRLAKVA